MELLRNEFSEILNMEAVVRPDTSVRNETDDISSAFMREYVARLEESQLDLWIY